jgi:Coenzyme PQQ synthesis protein D (PqqD)
MSLNIIQTLRNRVAPAKPKVTRGEILAARPLRNELVTWERVVRLVDAANDELEESERVPIVMLTIPRRKDRWGNLMAAWLKLPETRKVELDEMGSDVWERCDGNTSVDSINRDICAKYRLNKRQGEVSVTAYLKMLADRRFIRLKHGKMQNNTKNSTNNSAQSKVKKKKTK